MKNSRFFSVMVVGEQPNELMEAYDYAKKVEPYVVYRYLDAEKYRKTTIKLIESLINNFDVIKIDSLNIDTLQTRLKDLKNMSNFEYYKELTQGYYYDETGNALSEENADGHWNTCNIGKNFAIPLKLKDGSESYSARKKDVDWNAMHKANKKVYETAWELVMEDKQPSNDEERTIYNAMQDKQLYFSKFKNKEHYVDYSTSYWNFAYVDEKHKWVDINSAKNDEEWINTFYERFVLPLQDDDLITIFECSVNN